MTIHDRSEHIEFSMTFDAPVTVTGDPTFAFDLDAALVHNSRSRSIIALHPEIRGPA